MLICTAYLVEHNGLGSWVQDAQAFRGPANFSPDPPVGLYITLRRAMPKELPSSPSGSHKAHISPHPGTGRSPSSGSGPWHGSRIFQPGQRCLESLQAHVWGSAKFAASACLEKLTPAQVLRGFEFGCRIQG